MKRAFCCLVLAAASATIVFARQTPNSGSPQTESPSLQTPGMAVPLATSTAPELQKLVKIFSGTWSIVVKLEPTPIQPKGETVPGEVVWRTLGGGSPLLEEYHAKSKAGEVYNSAILWWDAKLGKYQGTWCANYNQVGCSPFETKWNGDQIVLSGEFVLANHKYVWYDVFTLPTPDSFLQTVDVGQQGKELLRVATVRATRTSKRP